MIKNESSLRMLEFARSLESDEIVGETKKSVQEVRQANLGAIDDKTVEQPRPIEGKLKRGGFHCQTTRKDRAKGDKSHGDG